MPYKPVICALLLAFAGLLALAGPIHVAADDGDTDRVRELLEADPTLRDSRDANGYTPLHAAARAGRLEVVELLLMRGAAVNAVDTLGVTPLYLAVRYDWPEVVALLKQRDARAVSGTQYAVPPPALRDGDACYLPLRYLAELTGATLTTEKPPANMKNAPVVYIVTRGATVIRLAIPGDRAVVGAKTVPLSAPLKMLHKVPYVPLDFVTLVLAEKAVFTAETGQVQLTVGGETRQLPVLPVVDVTAVETAWTALRTALDDGDRDAVRRLCCHAGSLQLIATRARDESKREVRALDGEALRRDLDGVESVVMTYLSWLVQTDAVQRVSAVEWAFPLAADDPPWQWVHAWFEKDGAAWRLRGAQVNFTGS